MGTVTATPNSTELVIQQIGQLLGPDGAFAKRKVQLRAEYGPIVLAAKKITAIANADEAQEAANAGRVLKAGKKDYETAYKTVKSLIDDVKKPILAAEKEDIAPFDTEGSRLGALVQNYNTEVERKRQEEQRIAQAAADAAAKVLREQEEARLREEALLRAIELEEAGDTEAAQEVLARPIEAEPIYAEPVMILSEAPAKPKGSVTRTTYSAEVTSLKELVAAVAAGKAPLLCLAANEKFLNDQADSYKEAFAIPGCKLKTNTATHFRS